MCVVLFHIYPLNILVTEQRFSWTMKGLFLGLRQEGGFPFPPETAIPAVCPFQASVPLMTRWKLMHRVVPFDHGTRKTVEAPEDRHGAVSTVHAPAFRADPFRACAFHGQLPQRTHLEWFLGCASSVLANHPRVAYS